MKKFLTLLILLVITGNIFIFIYGVYAYGKASAYEKKQRENFMLDSALTLALHAHEDNMAAPGIEKEFDLNGAGAGFVIKKLDAEKTYIKVYIKTADDIVYREYLKDASVYGAVPARIAPMPTAAAAVPVPATKTAVPAQEPHIVISPTPTAIAVPTFTLIK